MWLRRAATQGCKFTHAKGAEYIQKLATYFGCQPDTLWNKEDNFQWHVLRKFALGPIPPIQPQPPDVTWNRDKGWRFSPEMIEAVLEEARSVIVELGERGVPGIKRLKVTRENLDRVADKNFDKTLITEFILDAYSLKCGISRAEALQIIESVYSTGNIPEPALFPDRPVIFWQKIHIARVRMRCRRFGPDSLVREFREELEQRKEQHEQEQRKRLRANLAAPDDGDRLLEETLDRRFEDSLPEWLREADSED